MSQPELSVIFGTYNRLESLKRSVASVRSSVGDLSYEIVLTDGGSRDGTLSWIAQQSDIVLAETNNLRGAVSAFNAAWSKCTGKFVANFNDDAEYLDMALFESVQTLRKDPSIGQIAMEFDAFGYWHHDHIPYTLNIYGNYGVSKRSVVEKVCEQQGCPKCYWSRHYRTYAADCEHSAWILRLGLKVHPSRERVRDWHLGDGLRVRNVRIFNDDLNTFLQRKYLWADLLTGAA